MKKLLLGFAALGLAASVQAQHITLYEEFTGENCGPCAQANPGLMTLINANPTKVIHIAYQSPIPSAGPIYNAYKTITDARLAYYAINFAPSGRLNAITLGTGTNAGHIAFLTQSAIDSVYNFAEPFNMTASHTLNAATDSITATINISALSNYAPAGANLKLRVAIIEHLKYCTSPGSNGETEFHDVVREMYPNATGTQLSNSWTTGQTQTLTIKGLIPPRVDKANDKFIVVAWIQNDGDKSISAVAKSAIVPLTRDAALTGCPAGAALTCASGSTATLANGITLANTGTTTLTSATIYYKVDNGAYTSYSWTGNLAGGANTTVTLPAASLTAGFHQVTDSIGTINGVADANPANNNYSTTANVISSTGNALPIATGFENAGAVPTNYVLYDANGNGENWVVANKTYVGATSDIGHNGSTYTLLHNNYGYAAGEANYAILPTATLPAGNKTLDFWVAYAQYTTENDKLEVVYSTNCGTSWTSVWSAAGTALATHAAVGNNTVFVPTAADWKLKSVAVNSIPAGAMIAMRATSDYGNELYVDDIQLRTGTPTGIAQVIAGNNVTLAPNPTQNASVLTFSLVQASNVQVQVLDAVGRVVANPANANMPAGQQHINISTDNIPAGLYNVVIRTEEGTHTERLSVIK